MAEVLGIDPGACLSALLERRFWSFSFGCSLGNDFFLLFLLGFIEDLCLKALLMVVLVFAA